MKSDCDQVIASSYIKVYIILSTPFPPFEDSLGGGGVGIIPRTVGEDEWGDCN